MKLKDPFGNLYFFKSILIFIVGWFSWYRLNVVNKTKYSGLHNIKGLPKNGVLFVSNHQTYYADVVAINHGFMKSRLGKDGKMGIPFYLFWPKVNTFYVAAKETMVESGFIPKLFSYGGAILVKRTWREKGKEIHRQVDTKDQDKIGMALDAGWIVTFPQGTTTPYTPLRKGTAHIIKENEPIVIPVKINGFRRAFDKKGLLFKKRGVELQVEFKKALKFNADEDVEKILQKISNEIGQDDIPKSLVVHNDSSGQKS